MISFPFKKGKKNDNCLPQKLLCALKNQNKAATDVHSLQRAITLNMKSMTSEI